MADENKIEVVMSIVNQMSGQLQSISSDFTKFKVTTEQNGNQIAQGMNNTTKAFLGFVGLPVTLMAVKSALASIIKETFGFSQEAKSMSTAMGISINQFLALRKAAIATDTNIGTTQIGFMRLAMALEQVKEGSEEAKYTLGKLGIGYNDIISGNLDLYETFIKVGEGLNNIKDTSERLDLARKVLGRGGAQLLEMMGVLKSRQGLSILTDEDVKRLEVAGSTFSLIWDAYKDIGRKAISFFLQPLILSPKASSEMTEAQRKLFEDEGLLVPKKKESSKTLEEAYAAQLELKKSLPGHKAVVTLSEEEKSAIQASILGESEKYTIYQNQLKAKQIIAQVEAESGGNLRVQKELLTAQLEDMGLISDQWFEIKKQIDEIDTKSLDYGWTAAMNHMRDASVDWGKSLIKIVDDIRASFSDAFYSIGEMFTSHTGSWKETLRKFYQSVSGSIGRGLTNYMGTAVTSLFTPGTAATATTPAVAGGALGGITSALPYVAAIAAAVMVATAPAQRHKESMDRWKEKTEINRQVEREKAVIWAKEYAAAMEKAGLTAQYVSGGLATTPVSGAEMPQQVDQAARQARATQMRNDTINAAHAQYKHSKSDSALNYYYSLIAMSNQWWLDQC